MDTIKIKCPIIIKVKINENFKKQLVADIQENIKKNDIELQQIEFQIKRLMSDKAKQDTQSLFSLRQQTDNEKQKRIEIKNNLLEKLKETALLKDGTEIVQGTMERDVVVSIGCDLHRIMSAEIILEDGKIVAFRN